MACIVKERDGKLAYRLFWNGYRSWEGTGLRATDKRRATMAARALIMSQEMDEGRFDYIHWFPDGAKAYLFRKTPTLNDEPKSLTAYVERTWLPRKTPPNVRASLEETYRKHWRKHLKPEFGTLPLSAITTAKLVDFRTTLTKADPEGKGLKMKTARDIIDGTLRAIYRDARKIDRFVAGDPFADVEWPTKIVPPPDPFTAEERDLLLEYFWQKKRHYYPLAYTCFYTGIRTGEAVGLRWGSVDLRLGKLTVQLSRTLGEDNPPKTTNSNRDVPMRPELVAVLRDVQPLRAHEDAFVFVNQAGNPLDEERFVEKHWRPALRATKIRPRKFYACRATFISLTLMAGVVKLKRLAEICGTSSEMIEKHYAKWMDDDRPEELAALGGNAPTRSQRLVVVA